MQSKLHKVLVFIANTHFCNLYTPCMKINHKAFLKSWACVQGHWVYFLKVCRNVKMYYINLQAPAGNFYSSARIYVNFPTFKYSTQLNFLNFQKFEFSLIGCNQFFNSVYAGLNQLHLILLFIVCFFQIVIKTIL